MKKQNGHIVWRNPQDLKQHALHITMYGEDFPEDMKKSIDQDGVLEPLCVCRSKLPELNDFVVSGRRRRNIAIMVGRTEVPTVEWLCDEPLEFEKRLISSNIKSETTAEQKARAFARLKEIEAELAQRRMRAGVKTEEPGAAADIAAKKVGMSRGTAQKAERAVKAIDKLESEGKKEEAQEIRQELNQGSVAKAERMATEAETPAPQLQQVNPETKAIDVAVANLVKYRNGLNAAIKELTKAIDNKNQKSQVFRSKIKKFEGLMTVLHDAMEAPTRKVSEIQAAWESSRGALGNE